MASVRQIASCIGISGERISIINDFYGYKFNGFTGPLSLLEQVHLLQGSHIHLNLIRVGTNEDGYYSDADEREIDFALQIMRDIYVVASLGVGRVERYFITAAQADGYDNIVDDDEAKDLTDDYTVDNDALDIFFVRTYSGTTIGYSRVDGPCDKDKKSMNGSVVAIEGDPNTTGFVLAHEVGHYLGLKQEEDPINDSNLMYRWVPNGGNLTASQGNTMRSHCFVKSGCR